MRDDRNVESRRRLALAHPGSLGYERCLRAAIHRSPASDASLAAILLVQLLASVALFEHCRDELNPDAVAYARIAGYWLRGDVALALNATWGVLCSWLAVPAMALGVEAPDALRSAQIAAALAATIGTWALLGCFRVSIGPRRVLVLAAALHGAAAATTVLASDAVYLAVFVWLCVALLTDRERILGAPRPFVAGAVAGLLYLARPVGLPTGVALVVGSELLRDGWRLRTLRNLARASSAWMVVVLPWIVSLSLHYGALTVTHSPRLVHMAVSPRTGHPWNLPSFTRLHAPLAGRITTWEDPSTVLDPTLEWSPFDSPAAWRHQTDLFRLNIRAMFDDLVAFDGSGVALASMLIVPLLALVRPRDGVRWREPWLLLCLSSFVVVLAPLHVEARYLWPLLPVGLAALGSLAARIEAWCGQRRMRRLAGAIAIVLIVGLPAVAATAQVATVVVARPRGERALARQWAEAVRRVRADGPVVSWTPYAEKALDPEGLYLAWMLDRPWLGNVATDGSDLADAMAIGATVVVAKVPPGDRLPAWLGEGWSVVAESDVAGTTFRNGRYVVLVKPDLRSAHGD